MALNDDWAATKQALLDGLDAGKTDILSRVLENQKEYVKQSIQDAADAASAGKILFPMIRRIIPGMLAEEIVNCNPVVKRVDSFTWAMSLIESEDAQQAIDLAYKAYRQRIIDDLRTL